MSLLYQRLTIRMSKKGTVTFLNCTCLVKTTLLLHKTLSYVQTPLTMLYVTYLLNSTFGSTGHTENV